MMSTPDPIYSSLLGVDSESDLATKHKKENSGILGGRPSANIITSRSLLTCYVYLAEDIRVSVTTREKQKKRKLFCIYSFIRQQLNWKDRVVQLNKKSHTKNSTTLK